MATVLEDLFEALGWQGGTIHDALREVRRLRDQKPLELYDSQEGLTPLGREVDGIAYINVDHAMDELLAKGLTVKQASLLLYEAIGFVGSSKILDNRDKK